MAHEVNLTSAHESIMAYEVNNGSWVKGRFVHWVVHMLYTIRKKFYLEKVSYIGS